MTLVVIVPQSIGLGPPPPGVLRGQGWVQGASFATPLFLGFSDDEHS